MPKNGRWNYHICSAKPTWDDNFLSKSQLFDVIFDIQVGSRRCHFIHQYVQLSKHVNVIWHSCCWSLAKVVKLCASWLKFNRILPRWLHGRYGIIYNLLSQIHTFLFWFVPRQFKFFSVDSTKNIEIIHG